MLIRTSRPDDEDEDPGHAPLAEINVTPMVDVMLVLLVIFMVAAPLLSAGVPLELPKTEAARLRTEAPLLVSLDGEGRLFLGREEVPADALKTRLAAARAAAPTADIQLRADRRLDYGRVAETLATLAGAGFGRIALVSEPVPR